MNQQVARTSTLVAGAQRLPTSQVNVSFTGFANRCAREGTNGHAVQTPLGHLVFFVRQVGNAGADAFQEIELGGFVRLVGGHGLDPLGYGWSCWGLWHNRLRCRGHFHAGQADGLRAGTDHEHHQDADACQIVGHLSLG